MGDTTVDLRDDNLRPKWAIAARGGRGGGPVMGFHDGRFVALSESDKRDVLKLMARVAEQAYRRGAQQGAGLAQRPSFRADLGEWRYGPSLDLSPWVDSPRMTTSLERLDGECGELRRIGL